MRTKTAHTNSVKELAGKKTAKLFSNGGSQAVRLPKEFSFEGTEVLISRDGDRVVLEAALAQPHVKTMGDLMQHLANLHPEASKLRRPSQPVMPTVSQWNDD